MNLWILCAFVCTYHHMNTYMKWWKTDKINYFMYVDDYTNAILATLLGRMECVVKHLVCISSTVYQPHKKDS